MLSSKLRYHVVLNASSIQRDHAHDGPVSYFDQGRIYRLSILDADAHLTGRRMPQYHILVGVYFAPGQHQADHYARLRRWNNQLPVNAAARAKSLTPAIEYAIHGHNELDQAARARMQISDVAFDSFQVSWTPDQATDGSCCVIPFKLNFFNTDFSCKEAMDGKAMTLFVRIEEISPLSEQALELRNEGYFLHVNLFFDCSAEQRCLPDCQQLGQSSVELSVAQTDLSGASEVRIVMPTRIENDFPWSSPRNQDFQDDKKFSYPVDEINHNHTTEVQWERVMVPRPRISTRTCSVFLCAPLQEFPYHQPWDALKSINAVSVAKTPRFTPNTPTPLRGSPNPLPGLNVDVHPSLENDNLTVVGEPRRHQPRVTFASPLEQHHKAIRPQFAGHRVPDETGDVSCDSGHSIVNSNLKVKSPTVALNAYTKPVVCFYVRLEHTTNPDYRAIYLPERKMAALVEGISTKFGVLPESVGEVLYFNERSGHVVVDEEGVSHLPDGQDMLLRLTSHDGSFETTGATPASSTSSLSPVDLLTTAILLDTKTQKIEELDEVEETAMFLDLLDFAWDSEIPETDGNASTMAAHLHASPTMYREPSALAQVQLEHYTTRMDSTLWPPSTSTLPTSQAFAPPLHISTMSPLDTSALMQVCGPGSKTFKRTMDLEPNLPRKRARSTTSTSPPSSTSFSLRQTRPPTQRGSSYSESPSTIASSGTYSTNPSTRSISTTTTTATSPNSPTQQQPQQQQQQQKQKRKPGPRPRSSLDPHPAYATSLRERERNRLAALKCRAERTARTRNLQSVSREAGEENRRLRALAGQLRGEVEWLEERVGEMVGCRCRCVVDCEEWVVGSG